MYSVAWIADASRLGICKERPRRGKSDRLGVTGVAIDDGAGDDIVNGDGMSFKVLSSLHILLDASIIKGDGERCVPPPSDRLRVFDMGRGEFSNPVVPSSPAMTSSSSPSFNPSITATSSYSTSAIQTFNTPNTLSPPCQAKMTGKGFRDLCVDGLGVGAWIKAVSRVESAGRWYSIVRRFNVKL